MFERLKNVLAKTVFIVIIGMVTACLFTSCSDDDNVEKYYKVYNTDTGEDVPVFTSYNNYEKEDARYIPSRTDCFVINRSESENEATTSIKIKGCNDTLYVQGKYLFVKEVDGISQLEKMSKKDSYTDQVINIVHQLQDSHLHYTSSPFMVKIKFGLLFIPFIIAFIYILGGFEKAEENPDDTTSILDTGQKWYKCLPAVILGLWMMYYLFVDVIVLGDGYFRAIESGPAFLDFQSLGWFLNLLLTIIIGFIYLICAVLFSLTLMFFMVITVPVIGFCMTGVSRNSLIGNAVLCIIATLGFGLAYFLDSVVVLYVTLALSVCCVLWLIWIGYSTRNYQALLATLLPCLYVIALVSLSFLLKFFIATSATLAVFLAVFGIMATRSKFQSQGSTGNASSDYICDTHGNRHYVSHCDGDYVHTTDGGRYRRRPDGNHEEI